MRRPSRRDPKAGFQLPVLHSRYLQSTMRKKEWARVSVTARVLVRGVSKFLRATHREEVRWRAPREVSCSSLFLNPNHVQFRSFVFDAMNDEPLEGVNSVVFISGFDRPGFIADWTASYSPPALRPAACPGRLTPNFELGF